MITIRIKHLWQKVYAWFNSRDALLFIIISLCINRFTDWFPKYWYVKPFPFYQIVNKDGIETGITFQNYYFDITLQLSIILFWNTLMQLVPNRRKLFSIYRFVEILALIDYVLIYEKPFLNIGFYGVEFTDFRILTYAGFYILWKRSALY